MPEIVPSDEVNPEQLKWAKQEGEAYRGGVDVMVNQVADTGGTQQAGDYLVGFAQERAEGMYHLVGEGQLEWGSPGEGENCHLEVTVMDAADGRFLPALEIQATLTGEQGSVGPVTVPFLWHPGLFHYGVNLALPGDGVYRLHLRIAPPTFMRHDKVNGQRYASTVEVTFEDVQIQTGRE